MVVLSALALLGAAVGGVIVRPFRLAPWTIPLAAAVVAMVTGLITPGDARDALDPLGGPVAFLLVAVPLAVLLDELGFFAAVADRLIAAGYGTGSLWAMAALTTTLLNLDASVVLLTPLFVSVARRSGRDPLVLAFPPVLLACLASSALPWSNLTNLIVVEHTGATTVDFLVHLGLPSLVATVVGWWCYRRALAPDARADQAPPGSPVLSSSTGPPHALATGSAILGAAVVGFVAGPAVGIEPWAVALTADIVLVALLRRSPWRAVPVGTAVVVASLAVLTAAATAALRLDRLADAEGTLALAATVGGAAVAANVANNLPALLAVLPSLDTQPTAATWAMLVGVNMGPVVLVTGSLASLLWLDATARLGVPATAAGFTRVGVRVGLPAAAAGAAVFLALQALR